MVMALNTLVSFISVLLKLFLWLRVGNIISCHVHTQRGATLCYTVARTGPLEIMYRKIKNAPAHHPPSQFHVPCISPMILFICSLVPQTTGRPSTSFEFHVNLEKRKTDLFLSLMQSNEGQLYYKTILIYFFKLHINNYY